MKCSEILRYDVAMAVRGGNDNPVLLIMMTVVLTAGAHGLKPNRLGYLALEQGCRVQSPWRLPHTMDVPFHHGGSQPTTFLRAFINTSSCGVSHVEVIQLLSS